VIEPPGGYKSKLPDDEVLPADVDPDPCANPAKVSELSGIVVGVTLAKTLNLGLGDCVTVTSPTIGYSFSGGALKPPVARRYRVIALFQAGFDQYDSKLVYTDLYEAQTFYDQGDTVTGVEMIVDDIDKAPKISKQIADMLGSGLYHTMDWEELNHGLFTALRIQQIGMSFVLALIILVAAFTVVATLVMVILDKKKEIAVMKAMGATDEAILRIFLYQGGIIGFVGAGLGLLLGLLVCKGLLVYGFPLDPKVYFISRLPVQVRPLEFFVTGEVALAICLEATILPSLYAANLSPAEGFRDQEGSSEGPRQRGFLFSAWLFLIHYGNAMGALVALLLLQMGGGDTLLPRWSLIAFASIMGLRSICALALLLWKRWGFWGLCLCYGAGFVTQALAISHTRTGFIILGVSFGLMVLVIGLTLFGLRRQWRYLE
jgi:lipoprotein-releasing system permease protein